MAQRASEQSIFLSAIGLSTPAARAAYLDEACRDQPGLRADLDALLAAHDRLGGGPAPAGPDRAEPPTSSAAEAIGAVLANRYQLLQPIGEGGMGTVWMAEQTEPVQRRVALKVIKAGMDSRQVLARFEAERQALALMDHPHIAKVLDGGTTPEGRPYFVMELVQGIPITAFCDMRQLTPRERLELFIPVCQAVQHAHHKGVIHRDLKPSNVLVALYDGVPVPKVIDFGVAKATGQSLTERSLHTGFGAVVGTLEYMSPEQASYDALDVDTRSDIYSLGVLLYELLTGSPPFSRKELEQGGVLELLRLIREQEPTRPSTRLTTADGLPALAAKRGTEPKRLTALVKGELDWIVLKALDKDRSRRYETANGFALDVQRYLTNEPVVACPPSAGYRVRKFVRKHRMLLATLAAFMLLLAGGLVISTCLAVWAVSAEQLAGQRLVEVEKASDETRRALGETRKAQTETERALRESEAARKQAEDVADLLRSFFRDLDPRTARKGGPDLRMQMTARLDRAARHLEAEYSGDRLTRAKLFNALALAYDGLGEHAKSLPLHQKAAEEFEAQLGANDPATLSAWSNVGVAHLDAGHTTDAIRRLEAIVKLREAQLGRDHPQSLLSCAHLAVAYHEAGRAAEAMRLCKETLKRREATLGHEHLDTLTSRVQLANLLSDAGQTTEAIALYQQVLKAREARLGKDHPETLSVRDNLGIALGNAARDAEAIELLEATVQRSLANLGPGNFYTLTARNNLGNAYLKARRFREGVSLLEDVVKQREDRHGPDHPDTLASRNNLGLAYKQAGRTADAIRLLEDTLKRMEAVLGLGHTNTLTARGNLAVTYQDSGRITDAIRLNEETLRLRLARDGSDHPETLTVRHNLASAYEIAGRCADAIRLHEENLSVWIARQGPDHPRTLSSRNNLAHAYQANGRTADAIRLQEENLKLREARFGPNHPDTLSGVHNLGGAYYVAKEYARAAPLFERALEKRRVLLSPEHPSTLLTLDALAATYGAMNQLDKQEPLIRELLKHRRQQGGGDTVRVAEVMDDLALNLLRQRKAVEAESLLRECLKVREQKQPDDPVTFQTKSLLGASLLGQKKYTEAEPLLLAGYEGLTKRERTLRPNMKQFPAEALQRLVQLYDAWGKKDQADEWRKKRQLPGKESVP